MVKKRSPAKSKNRDSAESVKKTKNTPRNSAGLKKSRLLSVLKSRTFFRFVLGVFSAVFLYGVYCALTLPDIAAAVKSSRAPKIAVLASDGTEIASYGSGYGRPVDLDDLPSYVPQAVLATEDIRFYKHFGVDLRSVARAILTNVFKGRKAQGASTITQQVAKNLFLSSQKTVKRKVQELMLSFWLEKNLTKDQILTIYLNRVYFGAGTYGLDAAARKYFGVKAKKLSLYQAAVLAALLKAPSQYNPLVHPAASNRRARLVLANMVKAGFISAKEGLNAAESGAAAGDGRDKSVFYFTDWIADEVYSYLGTIGQDVAIETTLDPDMQKKLDFAISTGLRSDEAVQKNVTQAAGVVMAHDGAVLAMTGGRDYAESQFNRATQAKRQIGSAVKPFVYLTAFERGMTPDDTAEDKPVYLKGWSPKNADGKYRGTVTLREALTRSLNTVAVTTALKVGVGRVLQTARKFGIVSSDCEANAAIALGVCQTRLIDAVAAYASLANGGYGVTPYGIARVVGVNGEVLFSRSESGRARLVNPRHIVDLDTILGDVVRKGTGKRADPSVLAKGKTGTTQNYRDAWFIGYTADLAAGVWVGNDDETPMKKVSGGGLPAEIWGDAVREISLPPSDDQSSL